jgi:hypothetical protein
MGACCSKTSLNRALKVYSVKTYDQPQVIPDYTNHLMMLHVHKDITGAKNLVDADNDFVGDKVRYKILFGRFTANDIAERRSFESRPTQTS